MSEDSQLGVDHRIIEQAYKECDSRRLIRVLDEGGFVTAHAIVSLKESVDKYLCYRRSFDEALLGALNDIMAAITDLKQLTVKA